MSGFFSAIGDFVYAVVNLLLNLINGIVQLLQIVPASVTMLMNSVASMPAVLVAFAVGLVSVSVVYLIVGR